MGRRKKEDIIKEEQADTFVKAFKKETLEGIIAIVFIIVSIFLLLAPFQKAGIVGNKIFEFLTLLFGIGYYILPLVLLVLGVSFIKSLSHNLAWPKILGASIFTFSSIGLINLIFEKGGIVGGFISKPLVSLFDFWVTLILLVGLILISILVLFDTSLKVSFIANLFKRKEKEEGDEDAFVETEVKLDKNSLEAAKIQDEQEEVEIKSPTPQSKPDELPAKQTGLIFLSQKSDSLAPYKAPPISLFEKDSGKPGVGDIKANANIIKRTLSNFGIQVEMDEISIGPSVTRYALKPAEGVKLSRIVGLQDDLSLALAAFSCCLIFSQFTLTSPAVLACTSPNTCGWRRLSLASMLAIISLLRK
jgi:S-DNA-T family DNA segregation ATPase FtsK/SpoIIIE